ncbi:transcriptional regulator BetI [Amphritea sp. 2_MG-2023]|uniref:transcriptional regulator BetI n=1 Tax=Amphritea TaxID=515417 RepID=UPI001C067541|nr:MULTISPECIES: transcriptional regulator BetI [Amphritea]MBU2965286.1 transcriptional regulator BetI [Amphritea atlantica]MDO6420148.1 transcriptional regulator BetI [Amphritea sp. 2_MG-2023]
MPKVGMSEIRKPQLINATMDAINAVGLHKASVVMISSYAGVSPAIINHYFGGKSGLLEATMRSVLKQLSEGVKTRLRDTDPDDAVLRIQAVVGGNFSSDQMDSKVVKTWLAFWAQSMHDETLFRLQRVNEKRLLSYLQLELKKLLPVDKAIFVAQGIAALIDGIWLRGALSPEGINAELAQRMISDYLALQLA